MRLYIGGLPYETTEQDLVGLLEQAGTVVSATVITDKFTGRSKGFGFVDMGTDEEGQRAIEQLNGTTLGNRTITVNEARERQTSGSQRTEYGDRRSHSNSNSNYRGDRNNY